MVLFALGTKRGAGFCETYGSFFFDSTLLNTGDRTVFQYDVTSSHVQLGVNGDFFSLASK